MQQHVPCEPALDLLVVAHPTRPTLLTTLREPQDACLRSVNRQEQAVGPASLIGQEPYEEIRTLFARYPRNIEWTAWVAELGDVFASCSAMLVHLLFGSGVKVKTLEALHYALPVISTTFGAEGIVSHSTEVSGIIVENDLRCFPRHMQSLLDPQENSRRSREAREYYVANYGAEANAQQYKLLWGE